MSPVDVPPTGLPVEDVIEHLREALAGAGHGVLVAPPGAGKTTVVPLRLLDEPWLGDQRIVVLEPRRLAARAAARRMADLLGEPVGSTVGYRTRDERAVGPRTRVEVITEGILVRRLQQDPELTGTGAVLLDEVHERNLTSDLSLAMLLDARAAVRPDLRVLAMSATLDADRLVSLIGGGTGPAALVRSDGRQHPVAVRWWPAHDRDRPETHAARVIGEALRSDRDGDVLVFLPGAAEIDRVDRAVRPTLPADVDLHRLHGSLPTAEQDHALAPSSPARRRVVLSTDIAESSLTVAGVRIVVDAGRARGPRFDAATGLTRLVTVDASQASTEQRAGRAGRLGPGVAHRLWSEADQQRRPRFPVPEIAAADLAGLALELTAWGTGPAALPFLDQPPERAWEEAVALLHQLGAVDHGRLTPTGRAMVDLPLHPRLARLVVDGHRQGLGRAAALVAATLDERDVFGGRRDERHADLAERVSAVAGRSDGGTHRGALVDRNAVRTARRRAKELTRRLTAVRPGADGPTSYEVGPLVALAYPERVAQATGGGRFRLRSGRGVFLPATDPLASASFLAVAEVDPGTGDGRIRTAAVLDQADVGALVAGDVETATTLIWSSDVDDLRARTETRAGALVLRSVEGRAHPGPDTVEALVRRVRATDGEILNWTDDTRALQARIEFMRSRDPDRWPDVSTAALLDDPDTWLAPYLVAAVGRKDLERLDLVSVLRSMLDHRGRMDLDRRAPTEVSLPNGRRLRVDYATGNPMAEVRAQDLYGVDQHPAVDDRRVPVVLHVLSPARRPIQVTADLPGFWAGSWSEVRKEMAGRYPKHPWPVDPATSSPPVSRERR